MGRSRSPGRQRSFDSTSRRVAMKKLVVSIMAALTLCLTAAVAQTATEPTQASPGSSPSARQPSTPDPQQSMPNQQQPGQAQPDPAAGQAAQNDNPSPAPAEKEKMLRGCI